MTYNLELHELAEEELWEAVDWYDSKKNRLGKEFARELQEIMQTIRKHPSRFPKVHKEIRKAVLKRFPFMVLYELIEDTVFVLSIFNTSRNPKNWKERSKD